METATHEMELPEVSNPDQLSLDLGDKRRLLELAAAVREHRARVQGEFASARPHDITLYRRLRQIGGH